MITGYHLAPLSSRGKESSERGALFNHKVIQKNSDSRVY